MWIEISREKYKKIIIKSRPARALWIEITEKEKNDID